LRLIQISKSLSLPANFENGGFEGVADKRRSNSVDCQFPVRDARRPVATKAPISGGRIAMRAGCDFEMRMRGKFRMRRGGTIETRKGGKVDANM
jgi:hypothetical protein